MSVGIRRVWSLGCLVVLCGALSGFLLGVLGVVHAAWILGLVAVPLGTSFYFAWRYAYGTTLRWPVSWGFLAWVLAISNLVLIAAGPASPFRVWVEWVSYLASLVVLAMFLSVLNARKPGAGAWAWLMAMLVIVFLIPVVEHAGFPPKPHDDQLPRLEMPWSLFFGLLVCVGTLNFLPTRTFAAIVFPAVGLGVELWMLTAPALDYGVRSRGHIVWHGLGLCGLAVSGCLSRRRRPECAADALWLWFRDLWGAAWALRIKDRFNREAEVAKAATRLRWDGVVAVNGESSTAETPGTLRPSDAAFAVETLRSLLKRFADPARLDRVIAEAGSRDDAWRERVSVDH